MERILKVAEILGERQFTGKNSRGEDEQVTTVGLTLTNGADTFYVEGYRELVGKIKTNVTVGDLVAVRMSCDCRKRTTEKGVFYSNTIVLSGITVLIKNALGQVF